MINYCGVYFNYVADMYIIFAATSGIKHYYQKVAEFIDQKDNVGLLTSSGYALRDMIKTQYASIQSM